ncbi:MAG: phosphoglycerate mutase family protein [Acidimicrobiales bacterium]
MTIFVVRHASARSRSRWSDDDLERPLDDRGRRQADALTLWFADKPVHAVWSSEARRCRDTVAAVARSHGVDLVSRRELTEGARPQDFHELLRGAAAGTGDLVACSHGDLIPDVLGRLLREGMSVRGPRGCEKASIWQLETRGRDITCASYIEPPEVQ